MSAGDSAPFPRYHGTSALEDWMKDYAMRVERRRKHVDALVVVLVIVSLICILLFLGLGAFFITYPSWNTDIKQNEKVLLPVIGVILLLSGFVVGLWPAVSAWGIRRRKEWGRWSALIFCAISSPVACGSLCCLPVTIWGIWALLGPEADGVFGHIPRPPAHLVSARPPLPGEEDRGAPSGGYGEDQKPAGRTPIPQIYPRPRISSKTPPRGTYRYEPGPSRRPTGDSGGESHPSFSSIPTVQDIFEPGPDKEKEGKK